MYLWMDHQVQIEIYKFELYPPTLAHEACSNHSTDKNKQTIMALPSFRQELNNNKKHNFGPEILT